MTSRVTYKPLFSDELGLTGETWEHQINFEAVKDDGSVDVFPNDVCIYIPGNSRRQSSNTAGASHSLLVFWTANNAVGDTVLNDTLTHGLRAYADLNGHVLISLPSPGDHPDVAFTDPDFCIFKDSYIQNCFTAAGLNGSVGSVRLAAHSRGHRGLTRTLMGNNKIGEKNTKERDPATATVNKSFISPSKIPRIIYLDNFFASAERVLGKLVAGGLSDEVLRVFHVTDGKNIQDKTIVNNMASQFVDLAKVISNTQLAAIGSLRFIVESIAVKAGMNSRDLSLATRVFENQEVLRMAFQKRLPPRSTFSSLDPTPSGKLEIGAFSKTTTFTGAEETTLLDFLNAQQILRTDFQFSTKIAAHHFFVCEYAHEFYI